MYSITQSRANKQPGVDDFIEYQMTIGERNSNQYYSRIINNLFFIVRRRSTSRQQDAEKEANANYYNLNPTRIF